MMKEPEFTEVEKQLKIECIDLAHAMQAGVAAKMHYDDSDCLPKHLRVGINMAMVEHAALASLLIDKGIITRQEYLQKQKEFLQREVDMYKEELFELTGTKFELA